MGENVDAGGHALEGEYVEWIREGNVVGNEHFERPVGSSIPLDGEELVEGVFALTDEVGLLREESGFFEGRHADDILRIRRKVELVILDKDTAILENGLSFCARVCMSEGLFSDIERKHALRRGQTFTSPTSSTGRARSAAKMTNSCSDMASKSDMATTAVDGDGLEGEEVISGSFWLCAERRCA